MAGLKRKLWISVKNDDVIYEQPLTYYKRQKMLLFCLRLASLAASFSLFSRKGRFLAIDGGSLYLPLNVPFYCEQCRTLIEHPPRVRFW